MRTSVNEKGVDLDMVRACDLRVGMHVSELDRPWLGTPFMFQGFRIKSVDEIELLQKCCDYVYVNRKDVPVDLRVINLDKASENVSVSRILEISGNGKYSSRYADTATVEEELGTAKKIFSDSHAATADIFNSAESTGSVDLNRIQKATTDIVDSVLRNPDAFMLLQRLRNKSSYRYNHAVNCCSLAASFCRFLGFSRDEVQEVALGAMLLDIGTVRLPSEMLEMNSPLSPLLQKLARHHVNFGLDIVKESKDIPKVAHEMIRTHHERMSGKGYPAGLQGEQIPVSGRIAAIVDCYDAMVSIRPYRGGMPPTKAICELYKWRNIDFNEDLVEQFIQCVGAYPTGSLVELNSGQIGIILSQNRVHRLYPKVLVIMNGDRVRYEKPHTIDLWEYYEKTKGKVLDIKCVIHPDEININLSDYYL